MDVGNDARGNITRLDNTIEQIPKRMQTVVDHLTTMKQQMVAARSEIGKPFPQEAELRTKSARLAELDAELNMDRRTADPEHKKKEEQTL